MSTDTIKTDADTAVVNQNVAPAIEDAIESIPVLVKESKAGYKTTEFWVTIVTSLLVVLNGIPLPDKYGGFVVAALGAAYAISRGLAKKGVPAVEAAPDAPAA